jgi:hypothetical protein
VRPIEQALELLDETWTDFFPPQGTASASSPR